MSLFILDLSRILTLNSYYFCFFLIIRWRICYFLVYFFHQMMHFFISLNFLQEKYLSSIISTLLMIHLRLDRYVRSSCSIFTVFGLNHTLKEIAVHLFYKKVDPFQFFFLNICDEWNDHISSFLRMPSVYQNKLYTKDPQF